MRIKELYAYRLQVGLTDEDGEFYNRHKNNLKIVFNLVNREEAEDDPYYANMFADEKEVVDWGPRYRFDSLLKPKNTSSIKGKSKAPVVTFYSYKGGMGRTTTMVAYAMSLAVNDNNLEKNALLLLIVTWKPQVISTFSICPSIMVCRAERKTD